MENLYNLLYKLLKQEINDLSIGYPYNRARLQQMKELCHVIMYLEYVFTDSTDIMKIFQFYDNI